jgi:hypothetical protein
MIAPGDALIMGAAGSPAWLAATVNPNAATDIKTFRRPD